MTRYDVFSEMSRGNVAAGLSFSLTLVAIACLIGSYLQHETSVIGLCVWFVISAWLIMICRYLIDRFILPGRRLDDEISEDKNWGASFIEGAVAVMVALILSAAYLLAEKVS